MVFAWPEYRLACVVFLKPVTLTFWSIHFCISLMDPSMINYTRLKFTISGSDNSLAVSVYNLTPSKRFFNLDWVDLYCLLLSSGNWQSAGGEDAHRYSFLKSILCLPFTIICFELLRCCIIQLVWYFLRSADRKPPGVGRGRGRGMDDGGARGRGRGASVAKMSGNRGKLQH